MTDSSKTPPRKANTRINLNGKGLAQDGDLTTTGARCYATPNSGFEQRGYFALRVGDKTSLCPRCGQVGEVITGENGFMLKGRAAATDGSMVRCGCPAGSNRVIAPLNGCAARPPYDVPAAPEPYLPLPRPELEDGEKYEEEKIVGIVLHLGLFFDGTGNNQGNSDAGEGCRASDVDIDPQEAESIRRQCAEFGYGADGQVPDNSYGNGPSNIARLYGLYPDDADGRLEPRVREASIKVYVEGIGTRTGLGDSLYSQATGLGDMGVLVRVQSVPEQVLEQLRLLRKNNPGLFIRRIEIDLFGFSRGAAAARHFANDLLKGSDCLLARALPKWTNGLVHDFDWRNRVDYVTRFIGLFDTVAAIVDPLRGDFGPHNAKNPKLELGLDRAALYVLQLQALDEHRHNFAFTKSANDFPVPGCHSDVGGGYLPVRTERILLHQPFRQVVPKQWANERSEAYKLASAYLEELRAWQLNAFLPGQLSVVTWDVPLQAGGREPQKYVFAAVCGERQVRGELSLVYLRVMREVAVRQGVHFNPIDEHDPALALPDDLEAFADKMKACALGKRFTDPSQEELLYLRRTYVHHSVNWNAAIGKGGSGLDVMFINRPAKDGKRVIHPNE